MIKFYSRKGCSQCNAMKGILDNKKIEYEYIDDENTVLEIAQNNGIMGVPFGEINGVIYKPVEFKKLIATGEISTMVEG